LKNTTGKKKKKEKEKENAAGRKPSARKHRVKKRRIRHIFLIEIGIRG